MASELILEEPAHLPPDTACPSPDQDIDESHDPSNAENFLQRHEASAIVHCSLTTAIVGDAAEQIAHIRQAERCQYTRDACTCMSTLLAAEAVCMSKPLRY